MSSLLALSPDVPLLEAAAAVVRKAAMADVPRLLKLINGYAAQGIMLPRTEFELSENIRDFSVAEAAGEVAGCCALHFYTPTMGEVRSLAVHPDWKGRGAGRLLVEALEAEGKAFGLEAVFAFTYIPGFFQKLGFAELDRGELPLKAWKDCLRCPKFQCCDETAVIKYFDPAAAAGPRHRGAASPGAPALLPVLQGHKKPH